MYFIGFVSALSSVSRSARALQARCWPILSTENSQVAATETMMAPIARGPPRLGFLPLAGGVLRPRLCALVSPSFPFFLKGFLGFLTSDGPTMLRKAKVRRGFMRQTV